MGNQSIVDKIDRLGDLFADMLSDPDVFNVSPDKKEESDKLIEDIVDYLVWFPGALFFDENHARHKRNEAVIEML